MTTAWQSRAACIGSGLDWFPLRSDPEYAAKVAACRRVCVSCPVVADCLEYAMTIPPRLVAGVLAGMTQSARYKAQDAAEVTVARVRSEREKRLRRAERDLAIDETTPVFAMGRYPQAGRRQERKRANGAH